MQDLNSIVFYAVSDDMRRAPLQQFVGTLLASLASAQRKLLERAPGLTNFNDGGPCQMWLVFFG
jgi:hypothetical protein